MTRTYGSQADVACSKIDSAIDTLKTIKTSEERDIDLVANDDDVSKVYSGPLGSVKNDVSALIESLAKLKNQIRSRASELDRLDNEKKKSKNNLTNVEMTLK